MFLTFTNKSKTGFEIRKYIQTGNGIISLLLHHISKSFFTKCFNNVVLKTGNGIIQTGNGIIFFLFHVLKSKKSFKKISQIHHGFQDYFSKQEMELSKLEMELCLLFPDLN